MRLKQFQIERPEVVQAESRKGKDRHRRNLKEQHRNTQQVCGGLMKILEHRTRKVFTHKLGKLPEPVILEPVDLTLFAVPTWKLKKKDVHCQVDGSDTYAKQKF